MSIQKSLQSTIIYRILNKLLFFKIYDKYLLIIQFFYRKFRYLFFSNQKLKVYFEYYNHFTHLDIKKRYYTKSAPLDWSTFKSSEIVHCIQQFSPEYYGKKIIIEPSDHCLVIGASLGIKTPAELVSRREEIDECISSKISRVLVGPNDIINHAKYYFSNNALKKFFVYPEFSCQVRVSESYLKAKNKNLLKNKRINFLSIASNFDNKAVDLLIEAFLDSKCSSNLMLVCSCLPDDLRKKVLKTNNISLIEDLKLTESKKDLLYRKADIYINTTYIDGGFVAPKALEYGLPIITHTYHRGRGYVSNKNGILLSEPMKFYDPKGYGIQWNSIPEYLEQVALLKKKGGYENVQNQLINALKYYENYPAKILIEGLNSLELAKKNSLANSNQILLKLYHQLAFE